MVATQRFIRDGDLADTFKIAEMLLDDPRTSYTRRRAGCFAKRETATAPLFAVSSTAMGPGCHARCCDMPSRSSPSRSANTICDPLGPPVETSVSLPTFVSQRSSMHRTGWSPATYLSSFSIDRPGDTGAPARPAGEIDT